jgi:hypothetical protein
MLMSHLVSNARATPARQVCCAERLAAPGASTRAVWAKRGARSTHSARPLAPLDTASASEPWLNWTICMRISARPARPTTAPIRQGAGSSSESPALESRFVIGLHPPVGERGPPFGPGRGTVPDGAITGMAPRCATGVRAGNMAARAWGVTRPRTHARAVPKPQDWASWAGPLRALLLVPAARS